MYVCMYVPSHCSVFIPLNSSLLCSASNMCSTNVNWWWWWWWWWHIVRSVLDLMVGVWISIKSGFLHNTHGQSVEKMYDSERQCWHQTGKTSEVYRERTRIWRQSAGTYGVAYTFKFWWRRRRGRQWIIDGQRLVCHVSFVVELSRLLPGWSAPTSGRLHGASNPTQ